MSVCCSSRFSGGSCPQVDQSCPGSGVRGAQTRRRGTWGRSRSLPALAVFVDPEGAQRLEPRVDGRLAVTVTGLHALAALRTQAGAVGLAQRRDRLLEADRSRHERAQLQLPVVGQPGDLEVAVFLGRDGLAAPEVDRGQDLLVDPRVYGR